MNFGLRYANTGRNVWPDKAVAIAQAAEEAGFTSIWTVDHVVVPRDYQSSYPYAASGRMGDGSRTRKHPTRRARSWEMSFGQPKREACESRSLLLV